MISILSLLSSALKLFVKFLGTVSRKPMIYNLSSFFVQMISNFNSTRVTLLLRPPLYTNFVEPFNFFTAGDQLVVPIGVTHISLRLQEIQSREWEKKRTNEQHAWVNSSAEEKLCNFVHMLTNASVDSSENSTTLLVCRLIFPHCSGPHLIRLVSLLSGVDWSLASPFANCFFELFFPILSSRSLPTSGHPRSQVQNPLSGFAPKQTKDSSVWRTT